MWSGKVPQIEGGESWHSEKYDRSLCSLHKMPPDATSASLSLLIQLTVSQSHRPPDITTPTTVPYPPQREFSH